MGKRLNEAKWLDNQNRWQIKVQKDGVRRTFTSSTPGRKGKKVCHDKADAWLDDGIVDGGIRVASIFDEWIDEIKITTCMDHWRQYEGYGKNWIKPVMGNIKVSNLNDQHMQDVLVRAYSKGLAKKSLTNIRACLSAFVKYCRKRKATTLRIESLTIPRDAVVGKRVILQPGDLVKLLNADTTVMRGAEVKEPYINAYRFAAITGLRPGEIFGLMWSDINEGVAHIQRSINIHGKETPGKNDNARRAFKLIPLAVKILEDQRESVSAAGLKSQYVFPSEDGAPIRYVTYYKRWVRYRENAGIRSVTPYELRHTFVSIVKELPEGLLKPLVGHSKAMDSYGVYSHEVDGDMDQAAEIVQSLFAGAISKGTRKKAKVGL